MRDDLRMETDRDVRAILTLMAEQALPYSTRWRIVETAPGRWEWRA